MTSDDTQPIPAATAGDPEPASAEPEPASTEPVPAPRTRARSGIAGWINVALGLAIAVAIGGVAFAAGRMTAPGLAAAGGPQTITNGPGGKGPGGGYFFQGPNGGQGGPRAFDGGATIEGTVTAVTADSITIKTASGQEITVALNADTTYHRQSSATSSDVQTGGSVIVRIGLGKNGQATGPSANDITVVPQ